MALYSVSQVAAHLKEVLESDPLLADLSVEGEVSNLRISGAGHAYFTLKDDQAVLNCVMFRGQQGQELLANGTAVTAHGRIRFYEPRGSTDFMVDLVMRAGVGELAMELERLMARLEAEGLFEESRKRPLPQFPQVIGVVTSPSGAVFHDIQNVLARRYPMVELVLAPSLVQGPDAAADIVGAIEALNKDGRSDVVVVARGGGSLEELWPFNEEIVARAIYASKIPVVSAIGHETDTTIADMVADLRAPTPSAAAELVVPDQRELKRQLAELADYYYWATSDQLRSWRTKVTDIARLLDRTLPDVDRLRRRVDDVARTVGNALDNRLKITRMTIQNREDRIRALDPVATLRRGFSVVQKADTGQVVSSTTQVAAGEALSLTVSDGAIPATAGAGDRYEPKAKTARPKKKAVAAPAGMNRLL
ncbi:MAG: exodeoxyribonuclease VII large subunit [Chloroflexi bacterium]|nr:exodeoxyribonuclease VII large subunit [Chloroflexota bacterium]